MRSPNLACDGESRRHGYRQSLAVAYPSLLRCTVSGETGVTGFQRESVGFPSRARNTMSIQLAEQLLRAVKADKWEHQQRQKVHLKSTLDELQKKVNKAKKQIRSYTKIAEDEDSSEEQKDKEMDYDKNHMNGEDSTTIASSLGKLGCVEFQPDFGTFPKIKSYYLTHMFAAIEGKNKRAFDHLHLSHKIFKNYGRIQSASFADFQQRRVNLLRHKSDIGKKTMLIDIDQTLIHCEEDASNPHDLELPIQVENGTVVTAYITIRPYAISFLKRMSKTYEIIAFTASHQSYADVILDEIDPNREFIRHRLYRGSCIQLNESVFAKDLRVINRELASTILVDNAPYSYIFQLQNGIPILPYYCGEDSEFVLLQKYLEEMAKCQDVREFNKNYFKFHKYSYFQELDDLVHGLYLHDFSKK